MKIEKDKQMLMQFSEEMEQAQKQAQLWYNKYNNFKTYLADIYGKGWFLSDISTADFQCLHHLNKELGMTLVARETAERTYAT